MEKSEQSNKHSVSWYAGVCVGSTVFAGRAVTDALGSGVSKVGGVCRLAFRPEKAPTPEKTSAPRAIGSTGLGAGVARVVNVACYPFSVAGALTKKLNRVQMVTPRKPCNKAELAIASPVVDVQTAPSSPVAMPVSTRAQASVPPLVRESAPPRVTPPPQVAKPVTPVAPSPAPPVAPRREKVVFRQVTAEEAETANFSTNVQKVVFKRALSELSRPEPGTRVHAASILGGIHHPLSMRAVAFQLLRDESPEVRRACVADLVALGMVEALPAAEHALRDPEVPVRIAAVMAVYRLGGAQSAAPLSVALRDKDAEVRRMAVCCIGWLRQSDLTDHVIPLLNDESTHVRLSAAEALSAMRALPAVPVLLTLLADPVESVRRKAFAVLQEITGRKMSENYPGNDAERELLMARWRHWWKEEAGLEPSRTHGAPTGR